MRITVLLYSFVFVYILYIVLAKNYVETCCDIIAQANFKQGYIVGLKMQIVVNFENKMDVLLIFVYYLKFVFRSKS